MHKPLNVNALNMNVVNVLLLSLAVLAAALFSVAASAQQSPPRSEKSIKNSNIEEITVTGQTLTSQVVGADTTFGALGERAVLDTPFSVASFTEDLIRTTAAVSLKDLLIRDPSARSEVNAAGYQDRVSIRGFGVLNEAILYDGLPGLAKSDGFFALANLQNVQVFRGANAIVSGAAASGGVGGAFNLVPKRPGEAPVTDLTLGWQAEGPLLQLDLSRRFGGADQFGARLNLSRFEARGPARQFERVTGISALYLDWRPTDTLTLATEISKNDDRTQGYRDQLNLDAGVAMPRVPDTRRNYQHPWTYIDNSFAQVFVKGRWQFAPGWNLDVAAGRNAGAKSYLSAWSRQIDNAGTLLSQPYQWGFGNNRTTVKAAQLLLNGTMASGPLAHRFTLGYNWNKTKESGTGGQFGERILSNLFRPVYAPRPPIAENDSFSGAPGTSSFVGLYELRALDERLSLLAGGRYVSIEATWGNADLGQKKFSPFAALSWKPSAHSSVYASYTQALQPGGSAPQGTANFREQLPPGVAEQVELGAKLKLGELLLTAALFELEQPLDITNAANRFARDGLQRHRGLELQAQGRLGATLNLIAGVTLLDAEIDNGNPAVAGNVPAGVAERRATLFLDYRPPALPGLGVNAGLIYEGCQFYDPSNTREAEPWTRLDIGANYDFELGPAALSARFAITNLTDAAYWAVGGYPGYAALSLSAPRTFNVSLSASF